MPLSKANPMMFMMGATFTVFISAAHDAYTIKERRNATQRLVSDITAQGHYYKEVQGVYKGKPAASFMVRCDDALDLLNLKAMANKYMQECIMIVDRDANRVLLSYSDDLTTVIGRILVEVPQEVATARDSYSLIDNEYWVVTS